MDKNKSTTEGILVKRYFDCLIENSRASLIFIS